MPDVDGTKSGQHDPQKDYAEESPRENNCDCHVSKLLVARHLRDREIPIGFELNALELIYLNEVTHASRSSLGTTSI